MVTDNMIDAPRQLTAAHLREVQALLTKAAQILEGAPRALDPGDREVAEVLLPAWHAVHGNAVVTFADLRQAPAESALAGVVGDFLARFPGRPERGFQAFGFLLGRLVGHTVEGYTVRKLPATSGGVAQWGCSPL